MVNVTKTRYSVYVSYEAEDDCDEFYHEVNAESESEAFQAVQKELGYLPNFKIHHAQRQNRTYKNLQDMMVQQNSGLYK